MSGNSGSKTIDGVTYRLSALKRTERLELCVRYGLDVAVHPSSSGAVCTARPFARSGMGRSAKSLALRTPPLEWVVPDLQVCGCQGG
jgi:hypothetical protein